MLNGDVVEVQRVLLKIGDYSKFSISGECLGRIELKSGNKGLQKYHENLAEKK